MPVGHQIAGSLPATDVSRGNCPGRTGQVPFASEKFEIDRRSEKRVLIDPVFDFLEFLNGHGASEEEIFWPQIEPFGHVSFRGVIVVTGSDGVSVDAKI